MPNPIKLFELSRASWVIIIGAIVKFALQVLDATGQGHYVQTVYSQVYDLKKGLIYLYLFHNFQNGVVLSLADELAKGPHMVSVASLFPKNQNYEQWSSQQTD